MNMNLNLLNKGRKSNFSLGLI